MSKRTKRRQRVSSKKLYEAWCQAYLNQITDPRELLDFILGYIGWTVPDATFERWVARLES